MPGIKTRSRKRILSFLLITPLLLVLQFGIGVFIYGNLKSISKSEERETQIDTYLRTNTKFISNAESAQRGYLLTGVEKYLETYKTDMEELKKNEEYFKSLPADVKNADISAIQQVSKSKLDEMALTIALYRANEKDSSLNMVKGGGGKLLMDSLRKATTTLRNQITGELTRKKDTERYLFVLFLGLIALLVAFNLFVAWFTYKTFKTYTEHLEELVTSLEDANTRMTNYTTMSYHELKTPLRGISGFAQLLKKKFDHNLDKEEKDYVQYITDNVKKMDTTINEMRNKYLIDTEANIEHKND